MSRRQCGLWPGHRLFAALLAAAAALRIVVQLAYRPALFFYGDSFAYLANASHLQPESIRPAGYPAFLRVVLWVHDLAVVPAVQHLLGLRPATLVYALVRRLGIGPVGACIAAAPVLFDAYQLDIEQHILSEALFTVLVVAALAVLLWRSRPSFAACAGAGVLLAAAGLDAVGRPAADRAGARVRARARRAGADAGAAGRLRPAAGRVRSLVQHGRRTDRSP